METQQIASTKETAEPWLTSLRNALMREGTQWFLPRSLIPDSRKRLAISNRVNALKGMLACEQGNDEAIAVELARMLAAYPAQKTDDVSAELRMEAYFEALAGVPAWVVAEARLACLRGEGGCDPRFAPTPSQLSGICRERMRRMTDEMAELVRIAEALPTWDEPSAEERRRVSEGFSALRKRLGSQKDDITRESALEALRQRCIDNGRPTSVIDEIPDAPERTGSFASLKRTPEAA